MTKSLGPHFGGVGENVVNLKCPLFCSMPPISLGKGNCHLLPITATPQAWRALETKWMNSPFRSNFGCPLYYPVKIIAYEFMLQQQSRCFLAATSPLQLLDPALQIVVARVLHHLSTGPHAKTGSVRRLADCKASNRG